MFVLLKNGTVNGEISDVLIENETIFSVRKDIFCASAKVIDCTGLFIIPGIFDMHVHLREPGQTHKEDISTGGKAAAAGGVTGLMCMPNTSPVIDSPELVREIIKRAKITKIKVYPCASITKGLRGKELTDFRELKKAGAIAVSDDGRPVENDNLMRRAMVLAKQAGLKIISHCEDLNAANPRIGENTITEREVSISEELNAPIHIAHVSTKEALDHIRRAKATCTHKISGFPPVTCEVTPHHFTLTEKELLKRDGDYCMNPPLRQDDDIREIIRSLSLGAIDCIASDHAPHTAEEKADFEGVPNGVIGLETILSVTLTQLYHTGILPMSKIVDLLCVNPRRILGIPGGEIKEEAAADLCVFAPDEEWTVVPEKLHSKSKNTCFKGLTLKGRVKYTLVDGEVVYDDSRA
ncbi:MAG: dihydroorotase [Oscillospiraceae bacterium]|nr:dihydroorotase [Oscillospiraceae bacterium]